VASNLTIEEEKVTIEDTKGTLKIYADWQAGSGHKVDRMFCSNCGSDSGRVASNAEVYPGRIFLKMGMFPKIPTPE